MAKALIIFFRFGRVQNYVRTSDELRTCAELARLGALDIRRASRKQIDAIYTLANSKKGQ